MPPETAVDVLLVAPTDDAALADAFDRAERFRLDVVDTVEAALDRLQSDEGPPPRLLLVAVEGGGEGAGMELLQTVKGDPTLRRLPVITIGDPDAACELSYDRRANAHVDRPSDPDGFDDAVDRIESFWARAATLPPLTDDS